MAGLDQEPKPSSTSPTWMSPSTALPGALAGAGSEDEQQGLEQALT